MTRCLPPFNLLRAGVLSLLLLGVFGPKLCAKDQEGTRLFPLAPATKSFLEQLPPYTVSKDDEDPQALTLILADKEAALKTPEQALSAFAQGLGTYPGREGLSLGHHAYPFWFLIPLTSHQDLKNLVVMFEYYNLDQIELWTLDGDSLSSYLTQGDFSPSQNRAIAGRTANVLLDLKAERKVYLLFRIETTSILVAGYRIQSLPVAIKRQADIVAIGLFCFGMLALILFIALLSAIFLKSSIIAWYAAYVALTGITIFFTTHGFGFEFLWNVSGPPTAYPFFGIAPSFACVIRFLSLSLEIKKDSPRMARFFSFLMMTPVIPFVTYVVYGPGFLMKLNFFTIFFYSVIIFLSVLVLHRKHRAETRYYLLGFATLTSSLVIFAATKKGYLPANVFTDFFPLFGFCLEKVFMAGGLITLLRSQEAQRTAEKQASKDRILLLNQELTQSNQELKKALNTLSHEVASRIDMVEDLAHRGNNPLHVAQLALETIRSDLMELSTLLIQVFGPEQDRDEDARICFQAFSGRFEDIDAQSEVTLVNLQRMAAAIRDIRLLSGIDGKSQEWINWDRVWQGIQKRLCENIGKEKSNSFTWIINDTKLPAIPGHERIWIICLERWLRAYLEAFPEPIELKIEGQEGGLYLRGFKNTPEQKEKLASLLGSIGYVLEQEGVHLEWKTHEQQGSIDIINPAHT